MNKYLHTVASGWIFINIGTLCSELRPKKPLPVKWAEPWKSSRVASVRYKKQKTETKRQQNSFSFQTNTTIYFSLFFDDMFQSIDHHQAILTKLRVRYMQCKKHSRIMGYHETDKCIQKISNEWFYSLWYMKILCNVIQLLVAEGKLIHIIDLKAFQFKLDNVLLLKYIYMFVILSHKLLHTMQSQSSWLLSYTLIVGWQMEIFLISAPCFIYVGGCLIHIEVVRNLCVPR